MPDEHGNAQKHYEDPDWNQIQDEIQKRTEKIAGGNFGVSSDCISMMIMSPNMPDLELIDLPGFTENPKGNFGDIQLAFDKCIIIFLQEINLKL